ncbi:MAG: acyltransferase [Armatimonadota bacterium]
MTVRRDLTFDILKGIAILEVVTHHVLGMAARRYVEEGTAGWLLVVMLNRVLHFAVPTFLLVSALLLARSLSKHDEPNWWLFLKRRVLRTGYPYLVWTALYLAVRGWDTDLGLTQTLIWGKAWYHLYFLAILLEVSLLFPLLFLLLRAWRPDFTRLLVAAAAVQGFVYVFNYYTRILPYPGSSALFYLFPVFVGAWLGMNWQQWPQVWGKWKFRILQAMAVSLALYLLAEVLLLSSVPVGRQPYFTLFRLHPALLLLYSTAAALFLLRVAQDMAEHSSLRAMFAQIGDRSLAIFLVHPAVVFLVQGPRVTAFLNNLPLTTLWALLLVFSVSWAIVEGLERMRLSRLLFARDFLPLGAYSVRRRRLAMATAGTRRQPAIRQARQDTGRFRPRAASAPTRSDRTEPTPLQSKR